MKLKLVIAILVTATNLSTAQINSLDISMGLGSAFHTNMDGPAADVEEPRISWKAGINVNFLLADRVNLKTGIHHNQLGYVNQVLDDIRWPSEHDGAGGFEDDPNLPNTLRSSVNYNFFEIPLEIRYELIAGKIQPYFEGGIGLFLYRSTTSRTQLDEEHSSSTARDPFINTINLFGNVAIGVNYKINKNFQVFGQAEFKQQVNNLVDANVKDHLYQQGISIGVRRLLDHPKDEL